MRKILVTTVLALAVAPAAGAADSTTDRTNAAKLCKSLKTASGSAENFRSAIDALTTAKVTAKNAYGKCVSLHTADEAKERSAAQKAAKAACKAQKPKGKGNASAYGKCVSEAAKAHKAEADRNDTDKVKAAKICKDPAEKAKFSSFAKCVSTTAKKLAAERKAAQQR